MNENVNKKKSDRLERRWFKSVIKCVAKPTFLEIDKFWQKMLLSLVIFALNDNSITINQ